MFILSFNKKKEICPFKVVNEILYFNVFGICRKFVSSKCCIIFSNSSCNFGVFLETVPHLGTKTGNEEKRTNHTFQFNSL